MRICTRIASAVCLLLLFMPRAGAQVRESAAVETYTQYLPSAAYLGMGLAGAPARHSLPERAIELGVGFVANTVIVWMLKESVMERRPDGSDTRSFPSGHTARAFLGAELIRHEYGWAWGAGAYAVAASVGVMRVQHERHYWRDVLAGAGIGILSAQLGIGMREPLEELFGIRFEKEWTCVPVVDPLSGALCAGIIYQF